MFIQATAVSFKQGAILIQGPICSGKSILALKLIEKGAFLIADDGVEISKKGRCLIAAAPDSMRGCLEVRGIGIVSGFPVCSKARVYCFIRLVQDVLPRWSDPVFEIIDGVRVRVFYLNQNDFALDLKVLTAFRIAMGKFSLFSELNMLKQKKIQCMKRGLK